MNPAQFIRNFKTITKELGAQGFSTQECNNLALQAALKLEELSLQERQIALQEEQARAKMELELINANLTIESTKAAALNSLVQSQSMVKALTDNAAINRAQCHTQFLQVVGNATNSSGISQHSNAVINTINQIALQNPAEDAKALANSITEKIQNLHDTNDFNNKVGIYASRLETPKDEPIIVYGYSIIKDSSSYFMLESGDKIEGKSFLFKANCTGRHKVTFESKNESESASASIEILVV